ncbi:hypothetical protein [Paenibacillus odorifer]|uniref:Uncharacterized protein n=1 Tax=Paenibacillus odorifer TaxID=189426 RepID=A0AAD0KCY3_9BACL|nr:hypothetical protein [Paenibacillus odorifer]AWV31316.1 hypothetical protein CD191_01025 [Paenibacillus odorifer]
MLEFKEDKIRYLEMLQSIVTRMAANSFNLKSWTVTLVAGILALSSNKANTGYLFITFIPIIGFWFLDTYYLHLERRYRALFDFIRINELAEINFNLNPKDIQNESDKSLQYFFCFFSKSEWLFYLPLGVIVGVVMKLTNLI